MLADCGVLALEREDDLDVQLDDCIENDSPAIVKIPENDNNVKCSSVSSTSRFTPTPFDNITPVLNNSWLIKGVLSASGFSVLYGPSNVGKTFVALDLALHVACGWEWWGHRVHQGCVAYIASEGGTNVNNRIEALRRQYADSLKGRIVPLGLIPCAVNLVADCDISCLIQDIQRFSNQYEYPLSLIIVDTLNRSLGGGDENSSADMGALICNIDQIRQATGAHVMAIHHSGKDEERGARGHSSLKCACDTEIKVHTVEGICCLEVTKQRDDQRDQRFWFNIEPIALGENDEGEQITSCVVVPKDYDMVTTLQISGKRSVLWNTINALTGNENPARVSYETCRKKWIEQDGGKVETSKKSFDRGIRDLKRIGWIRVEGNPREVIIVGTTGHVQDMSQVSDNGHHM